MKTYKIVAIDKTIFHINYDKKNECLLKLNFLQNNNFYTFQLIPLIINYKQIPKDL